MFWICPDAEFMKQCSSLSKYQHIFEQIWIWVGTPLPFQGFQVVKLSELCIERRATHLAASGSRKERHAVSGIAPGPGWKLADMLKWRVLSVVTTRPLRPGTRKLLSVLFGSKKISVLG